MQHQFKTALALLAFAAPFGAQSLLEKLTWPLVDGTERFGSEIAVDGDLAAVSAPQAGGYQGGVATYKRDGDSWIQEALIVPSDGVLDDRFGSSLDLDGDRVIVGSTRHDSPGGENGKAYIYRRVESSLGSSTFVSWDLEGELLPTLPSAFASFAASVAIQGNWAAVGAPGQSTVTTNNGVVYVYRQSGGSWSLHTVLTADDANSYAEFGRSVEVGYNRVLVGAPYANGPQQLSGAVYSFRWDGIEWFQNDKLTAPGGETGDNLGFDVAAYGGRLVAGAKYADGGGKAYVFDEVHLSLYPFPDWYYWEHEATLVPADSANAGRFGSAVSMAYGTAGVTAVIGDEKSDQHVPGAGSAHVFVASGTTWTETAELVSLELQTSEEFGASVAHDGSHVLVGAPEGVSAAGNYAGEVFSFTLENKPLQVDTVSVSVSEGGTQTMTIDAGPEHAGKLYWVLGTLSGTSPGFELLGAHLPLNPDFYYNFTLQHPSLFPLVDTVGFLDGANGTATAAFTQPSDGKPSVVGLLMHHAYIVLDAGSIDFVSNPMPLEFTQ